MQDDNKTIVSLREHRFQKHLDKDGFELEPEKIKEMFSTIDSLDELHKKAEEEHWTDEQIDQALENAGFTKLDALDYIGNTEEDLFEYLKTFFEQVPEYNKELFAFTLDLIDRFKNRQNENENSA